MNLGSAWQTTLSGRFAETHYQLTTDISAYSKGKLLQNAIQITDAVSGGVGI